MSQRTLEIRVGVFAVIGLAVLVVLVVLFGNLPAWFESTYTLQVHFDRAPGMDEGTPVRKSGIGIGRVVRVEFDEQQGGVLVTLAIKDKYRLHEGAEPRIASSFLGDVNIDVVPGDRSRPEIAPGSRLRGRLAAGPTEAMAQIQDVGKRVSAILGPEGRNVTAMATRVSDQLVVTMQEFEGALVDLRKVIGNPENRRNLEQTLAHFRAASEALKDKLPAVIDDIDRIAEEIGETLTATRKTFQTLGRTAEDINAQGKTAMKKMADALDNASELFSGLGTMVKDFRTAEGSLQKLMKDPALFDRLNESADSLSDLMENLVRVSKNLELFSAKLARHPFSELARLVREAQKEPKDEK